VIKRKLGRKQDWKSPLPPLKPPETWRKEAQISRIMGRQVSLGMKVPSPEDATWNGWSRTQESKVDGLFIELHHCFVC
jgi:hypothetical protein